MGFDTDTSLSTGQFFQVGGSDPHASMDHTFNTYDVGDGWVHVTIPVGQHYTGTYAHLAFAADDDADASTDVRFANVRIYEDSGSVVTEEVTHTYDAFNQWVSRTVDPDGAAGSAALETTVFVHEAGQIVLQFDREGSGDVARTDLSHRYLWGPAVDQLLADEAVESVSAAGEVLWPLADHLGSVRDVVDSNGTLRKHVAYDSFGNITGEQHYDSAGNAVADTHAEAVDQLFYFTGRALDETTGLQNNLHRWYDPLVGRWASEDPIGFGGGDANLARYVGNMPATKIDPSGRFDEALFWRNVELFDPEVMRWFRGQQGSIEQGNYWFNVSHAWGELGPIVYLETDFDEIEAALAFNDFVRNSMGLGGHFRAQAITTSTDPGRALQDYKEWWLQKTAAAAETGAQAYLAALSIANEGVDWVLTTREIGEKVSQGAFAAAALSAIAYLPGVSGQMVRIQWDVGEWIVVPRAVQKFVESGKLGRPFRSHGELVETLGQARGHSWHHIVQQQGRNVERFGAQRIHNTANVIFLPNDVHASITRIQNSKLRRITGNSSQTVAEWISQFDYDEQWRFGRALVEYSLTGNWPAGYKFPRR